MVFRLGYALVPMLLAFTGTACGAGRATTTTTTTPPHDVKVFGVVLAGPTCAVVTSEQACPPRPVDAEIEAQNAAGETVARTQTDADGKYALRLAPGVYTVIAVTGADGPMFCDPVDVTVPTGPTPVVRADISCDTGIR